MLFAVEHATLLSMKPSPASDRTWSTVHGVGTAGHRAAPLVAYPRRRARCGLHSARFAVVQHAQQYKPRREAAILACELKKSLSCIVCVLCVSSVSLTLC